MENKVKCAFSVKYCDPKRPDEIWAADWGFMSQKWSRSWMEEGKFHWHPVEGLDEQAYKAILRKFGLERWEQEFPKELILALSPRRLAEFRRKKEQQFNLDHLEIISDTMGDHSPAEKFD